MSRDEELLVSAFQQFDVDDSGYIGYQELEELCGNLGFRLNAEQLQMAVRVLDVDGSRRIDRNEFIAWWTNPSAVVEREAKMNGGGEGVGGGGGSVGRGMASVATKGKSRLLQAKLARKQAENDAQQLTNRIALLKQEEAKAWKKIQHTKERAQEILSLRDENEQKQKARAHYMVAQQSQTRSAQNMRFVNKQVQRAQRVKAVTNVITKKREDVQAIRQQRRDNEMEKERQRKSHLEKARANRRKVRAQEQRLKREKARKREEQRRRNELVYESKVVEEEALTNKTEGDVEAMERAEVALIQRLQNAQMLQKEAYEQLESALTSQP